MNPIIKTINGPVVYAKNARSLKIKEMVSVGGLKLIGEVISVDGDIATIQVYEDTSGLKVGEDIISTSMPLSVRLGPGLLGNMFDGIFIVAALSFFPVHALSTIAEHLSL